MFERQFIAYGVRIDLRADCRALLDAFEQDPVRLHLPFGWRAVEDHEADDSVSVRYELRAGGSGRASPPCRVYAGSDLIAAARRLTDAGRALASPARRRWCRHGSRRERRTTPTSSRFSTAADAFIRSPVRWRSGTAR